VVTAWAYTIPDLSRLKPPPVFQAVGVKELGIGETGYRETITSEIPLICQIMNGEDGGHSRKVGPVPVGPFQKRGDEARLPVVKVQTSGVMES
jgi:hypothetical protein